MRKIISGGQTGADRAALDAAMEQEFPLGGYCPSGRQAEDGPIDERYPLIEIKGGYIDRTLLNVQETDATLIFFKEELEGGTRMTVEFCYQENKAHLLVDIAISTIDDAVERIQDFLSEYSGIATLNVAGPRHSKCPEVYAYVKAVIAKLISQL